MSYKNLLIFLILVSSTIYAQTVKESEAYKKQGFSRRTPLLKPKYPSYNLTANYILKEKARKGDPFAQHELGIRYILGIGVPTDTLKSAYWIGKAASKNLPAANFNHGIMLHGGVGVDWNPFSAFNNFEIAAESGMEQAQYILGLMYTDNLVVNKNLKLSQEWLKKSADKGFEEAKKVLEEFKNKGLLFSTDTLDDITNTQVVSKKDDAFSPLISNGYELDFYNFEDDTLSESEEKELLNEILSTKNNELKKMLKVGEQDSLNLSDTSSVGIINFAASSGSPEALLIKARLFENGIGVKQNLTFAASNYLKAFRLGSYKAAEALLKMTQVNNIYTTLENEINKNNSDAMYVWAGLIALGLDYSLTEEQAFDLLKKAEKQTHINSIIELGLAYYSGSLVEKDSLKALEYFDVASKLGSSEAKVRLAFISIQSGDTLSYPENIYTLKIYSEKGSVLAEAALAFCYENGIAIGQNKAKAAQLYREAANRGNEAAYNSLRNMYDALRPSDDKFQIYL